MDITPKNIITNEGGKLRSLQGPKATEAFRLRTIISGLKLEASTGMRLSRGISCLKIAKQVTGLRTNDRAKLTAALQQKMNALVAECLIVDEEDKQIP